MNDKERIEQLTKKVDALLNVYDPNSSSNDDINFAGEYENRGGGLWKLGKKGDRKILNDELKDFYGFKYRKKSIPVYCYITIGNDKYEGTRVELGKQLYNDSKLRSEDDWKPLFNCLIFNNGDKIELSNKGGYYYLDDLPKKRPKFEMHPDLEEFINALDNNQAYALKQIIPAGFVNIIRAEAVKSRGLVKAIVLSGAKYSGKTLIINLVRNMFDNKKISLSAGGCPQSNVALRNSLANTLGIVLCDECDGKMVRKGKRSFYTEIENILKGIYDFDLPKTSDLNNQGQLLDQEQAGLPVMTMNDTLILTEALKDRVVNIYFDNSDELPIIDLNKVWGTLQDMGKGFAYVFGKNSKELLKSKDNDELADKLIGHFAEEYKSDSMERLIDIRAVNQEVLHLSITEATHEYLINKMKAYLNGSKLIYELKNHWEEIPWIYEYDDIEGVWLWQGKFCDFVKSSDCLIDGGIDSKTILKRLEEEGGEFKKDIQKKKNGKNRKCIYFEYPEFLRLFDIST